VWSNGGTIFPNRKFVFSESYLHECKLNTFQLHNFLFFMFSNIISQWDQNFGRGNNQKGNLPEGNNDFAT
jgi:hypothetical protein